MEFYRIKHVPTGLYYKPGQVNLSKKGKVYTSKVSVLSMYKSNDFIYVTVKDEALKEEFGKKYESPTRVDAWRRLYLIPREEFIAEPITE